MLYKHKYNEAIYFYCYKTNDGKHALGANRDFADYIITDEELSELFVKIK